MRIVLFVQSLVSDWNHGNAHFLRGVASELIARGHDVRVFEPREGWSRRNLLEDSGTRALGEFRAAFPLLRTRLYDLEELDVERAVDGADLVLVHEWNEPWLVAELGRLRTGGAAFRLLFHDTHHRAVTAPEEMARFDLFGYDGVLAFGRVIRDLYLERAWAARAWTWHEAADARIFRPLARPREADVVWIGNWGDEERSEELEEFLIGPARELRLSGSVYGVRYPEKAVERLERAGLRYGGWLPNHRVPDVLAAHGVTVHVPRRPYARALPGIPTIRPFEALACAMPLVSAPWNDAEGLFAAGRDYLVARDGAEMRGQLERLLRDRGLSATLAANGRRTILGRHTCGHRVDELLAILRELEAGREAA
ncbi:MAG TPA: glycosyltransferase [Gaiellaceae bacterium]|nr:glycosyltransferase [Gaiellaceae bacterium]